MENKIKTS